MRAKPVQKHTLLVRGEDVSAIAIMSVNGLLDIDIVKSTVDSESFYDFRTHTSPFNAVNSHSVVGLDSCSIQHVEGLSSMIKEVGALVHFLPPYLPDFNSIKETFSKVKSRNEKLRSVYGRCIGH